MSDRYGEPVEVLRHFADPAHFIWHGRLYVVRDVVAHWAEADQWWRAALTRVLDTPRTTVGTASGRTREPAAPAGPVQAGTVTLAPTAGSDWVVTDQTEITVLPHMRTPVGSSELGRARQPLTGRLSYTVAAPHAGRRGGAVTAGSRRTAGDLDLQYEFWRVSAGPGRRGAPRVYDLCQDLGTGQWTLNRGDADVAPAQHEATDGSLS